MKIWTKDEAIQHLSELRQEIASLRKSRPFSVQHTRWLAVLLTFLDEVFGRNSRYYVSLQKVPWRNTGTILFDTEELCDVGFEEVKARRDQQAFLQYLDMAEGLLLAAEEQLNRVEDVTKLYEGKDTGPEASLILNVINLAERKLRKAIHQAPSKEKQLQDAFETLLLGASIPYSRETDSIEYSSKTYTPDFTVKRADLAIEIKLCARDGREKEVIPEINDDILAYKTKYGNLLFVVYDCGFIRDVERFTGSFEDDAAVAVRVVKH
jgi:hypothetical protein